LSVKLTFAAQLHAQDQTGPDRRTDPNERGPVGQTVISGGIEVSWSPPGPHPPANRLAGVSPAHGTAGGPSGKNDSQGEYNTQPNPTNRSPNCLSCHFPRFSSAYSLVCFGMARSRSGVKNRVKTTSSSLLLRHRMMAGSSVYSPWKSAFAMMGSMTRASGPLGGVGAALCT
jgi:hypothetical protein